MISVSMITRNSADVLQRCLESVKGADEIVIVDTGSEDKTIEIARKYTDKVFTYYGCNKPPTKDGLFMDFADARNESLKHCTEDYILIIDADEVLREGDMEKIRAFGGIAMGVTAVSATNGAVHQSPRVFQRHPQIKWKGAAHNHVILEGDGWFKSISGERSDVQITYYPNKQHKKDPDRTKRILENWIKNNKNDCTRERYYLAREYNKRGWHQKTIKTLKKYIPRAYFGAEKADAFVILARSYAAIGKYNKAVNSAMAALNMNPDNKEALRLAGDLSGDINRLKYQNLAAHANNIGVLFVRPDNRLRVTVLSGVDWAGSGYRICGEVRKASEGKIDIEAIVNQDYPCEWYQTIKTGVSLEKIGREVAQQRINDSDIIHFKGDWPYENDFHGLVIPEKAKIIHTVSGSGFRNKMHDKEFIESFKGDFLSYMTHDLHVEGWNYMPQPYTLFDYQWKKRKKFRIVHIPSDPVKKGTEIIIEAVKLLNRNDIEFVVEHGISHQRSIELKRDASIYIDQMILPPVANAAYEAMGFGVPVISFSDDPIVMSPKEGTAESLAELIESVLDWDFLKMESMGQFAACKDRCKDMGKKWMETYEKLAT